MSLRAKRRRKVTDRVLEEITGPLPLEIDDTFFGTMANTARYLKEKTGSGGLADVLREISDMTITRFTYPNQDWIDREKIRLRKEYKSLSKKDQKKLEKAVYLATGYMPDYSRSVTSAMYGMLKAISKNTTFDKIRMTGYIDDVMELSMKGRVVLLPTHKDMFDPIFVAYPFLERKIKPPVFHAGANLRGIINTFFINKFNALFLKRASEKEPLTSLDMLIYAVQTEQLLREKENMTVYPGATRSEDGKPPPLRKKVRVIDGHKVTIRPMAKGYLSCILRANEILKPDDEIYLVPVNVDSGLFPDVIKDFYRKLKTGKKPRINAVQRFFKNARIFSVLSSKTGIVVNYGEPIKIPRHLRNSPETRAHYTRIIRDQFRRNTTPLPEYIMGYSLNYMLKNEPEYHMLSSGLRLQMIRDLYINHAHYLKQPAETEVALKFYQDMGILDDKFIITDKFRNLLEYNSNTIEHMFKDDLPLTERSLLDRIKRGFDHLVLQYHQD